MLVIDLLLYSSARGMCTSDLRTALRKSEGLLLRVMGLRASSSEANADGSSNEETEILFHLDKLAAMLPHAEKEPAPRGIEFPLVLFQTVEQSLRKVAIELGTLEWMVSSNTELSGQKELVPILVEIEDHLTKLLQSSSAMFRDIAARNFLVGAQDESSAISLLRQEVIQKRASVQPSPSSATRRLSNLAEIVKERRTSTTLQNFGDLLGQLRAKARHMRGDLPTNDLLSQVELLLSVLSTVSSEAQKIQLVLAQY